MILLQKKNNGGNCQNYLLENQVEKKRKWLAHYLLEIGLKSTVVNCAYQYLKRLSLQIQTTVA